MPAAVSPRPSKSSARQRRAVYLYRTLQFSGQWARGIRSEFAHVSITDTGNANVQIGTAKYSTRCSQGSRKGIIPRRRGVSGPSTRNRKDLLLGNGSRNRFLASVRLRWVSRETTGGCPVTRGGSVP